jgi:hypothetical protein
VRIVHVVTKDSTEDKIQNLIDFCHFNSYQLSFKQLYGFDDDNQYHIIKSKFPNEFFLDFGDYNIYFMPDNNEYKTFMMEK